MAYVRGNKMDFDNWKSLGNEGWGYEDVLPYFIKSEKNVGKRSKIDGSIRSIISSKDNNEIVE